MKKNPFADIQNTELVKKLAENREAMRKLRFSAAGARSKDPSSFGKLRKETARIMNELRSRRDTNIAA